MADKSSEVYARVRDAFLLKRYDLVFKDKGFQVIDGPVDGYTLVATFAAWKDTYVSFLDASPSPWGTASFIRDDDTCWRLFNYPGDAKTSVAVRVKKHADSTDKSQRTLSLRVWLIKEEGAEGGVLSEDELEEALKEALAAMDDGESLEEGPSETA